MENEWKNRKIPRSPNWRGNNPIHKVLPLTGPTHLPVYICITIFIIIETQYRVIVTEIRSIGPYTGQKRPGAAALVSTLLHSHH